MRILFSVSDRVWGGKQQYMYRVISALAAHGHELVVACEEGGQLAARAKADRREVIEVAHFGHMDAAEALARCLARTDAGCVVATGRHDYLATYRALRLARRHPIVVLSRTSAFPIEATDEYAALFGAAHAILLVSRLQIETQFAELIEKGIVSRDRLIELRTAVDVRHFAPRPPDGRVRAELGIPGDAIVVGCVARLSWEKDHATLLRAFARVAGERPKLVLLLVGDGEMRPGLEALAAELGIAGRMRITGHRDDVAELLSICRLNALTSICPEHGTLSLQEAMAMELPVIGPRSGVLPDYIRQDQTGFLFEPGHAGELAGYLAALCDDEVLASRIGRNARKVIVERFDVEDLMRRYCRLFDDLGARPLKESAS